MVAQGDVMPFAASVSGSNGTYDIKADAGQTCSVYSFQWGDATAGNVELYKVTSGVSLLVNVSPIKGRIDGHFVINDAQYYQFKNTGTEAVVVSADAKRTK